MSETDDYVEKEQEKLTTLQENNSDAEKIPQDEERNDETQAIKNDDAYEVQSDAVKTDDANLKQSNNESADNSVQTDESKEPTTLDAEKPESTPPNNSSSEHLAEEPDVTSPDGSKEVQPPQTVPNATSSDTSAIAMKVVEYINGYRVSQGDCAATVLPGLTEYAEYRSKQLVSHFAHDTADERAAATALKYGQYVEPALYGMSGDPYYTANAREAIVSCGYVGTIDDVAQNISSLVKNSTSHWNYVGSKDYCYIAVGITYESGMWYCDIALTRTNTDIIKN